MHENKFKKVMVCNCSIYKYVNIKFHKISNAEYVKIVAQFGNMWSANTLGNNSDCLILDSCKEERWEW